MQNGNSLRSTTTLGNEKERERVYDTIFRLPWRCELLIDVGCFVCFNSFLSLLTIMPTRIIMTAWKLLKTRQFKRLSAMKLLDFGCFLIMSCGVILLQQTDISLIYHMIRGQGTIKLYVVYNVLEVSIFVIHKSRLQGISSSPYVDSYCQFSIKMNVHVRKMLA
ncbi:protein POLLEN DEFECTIVE IN GUIDANCE 1-like isoform X1 [Arachis stenosperma]|uniref:protein POLLEN DEFECTIVE IN GUIDANCE 1-like isoform X1 n=1 Tax=Arachis stenosperma TaxID=217475 RepID=UPI0025AD2C6D|nr:protein POLLEN DEFECTIVE IN GUIDANCE 1-like isoform X1 [Arachis stenosperma]XP_057728220.1 protein POLLEN DEFECTIVE IN GUIDANCE 1-like isoform X1 [Arachis stenosperma]XP_057728221.1 protein POLLEN DEFECTIVE IN GUIDANCE 1-like isoform X1 [Arachis stenosperma]XP_057728222.1 protein POLLEN DEFECTIVE IN GUIDANCE 1-like isoform X1 [Arachis stenosperma]